MMGKREKPVYVFRRKGNSAVPDMGLDAAAFDGIPEGALMRAEFKMMRSPPRLRLYWKMLSEIVKATECAPTKEHLHEAIKLELGYTQKVKLSNGMTVLVPDSISFESMDEATFTGFLEQVIRHLAESFGVDPLEFYKEAA